MGRTGNVWTEYIPTPEHVEYMIYPRLLALAEVAWTNPEQKDWKRFHAEALQEVKVLNSMGYHTFDLQNEAGNRPVALSVDNHLAKEEGGICTSLFGLLSGRRRIGID